MKIFSKSNYNATVYNVHGSGLNDITFYTPSHATAALSFRQCPKIIG